MEKMKCMEVWTSMYVVKVDCVENAVIEEIFDWNESNRRIIEMKHKIIFIDDGNSWWLHLVLHDNR